MPSATAGMPGREDALPSRTMWTEEAHAAGVADKVALHEEAAHEKRNWVRLTFDCNDHCVFCLDADTHNGDMRAREDVKEQILDGKRKGATRLILSGGEPTIHPDYVDFVRLGRLAGYAKIQTVTNGRLFSYGSFLERCLDEGLSEITFSIHGPNAKVHDALVGTKGAFDEEVRGLTAALADGRPIVNVDIVVNRANVRHLPEMLRLFYGMGVREFDLLQVVPFGRAFTEGRDTLFYDLDEARPFLQEALAFSKRPDVHMWMNRFPPQHLEGYEHLIQDPYKLNDEVRGRKEEFARLFDQGEWLDCREPSRCKHCYLERLCDTIEGVLGQIDEHRFAVVRVDTEWEAAQPAPFGGDPASAMRAREKDRRSLPLAHAGRAKGVVSLEALVARSGAETLSVCAPDLARVSEAMTRFPGLRKLELELDSFAGMRDALAPGGAFAAHVVERARARTVAQAEELLSLEAPFEVAVALTRETAPWLLSLADVPPRLSLWQPNHERLTEAEAHDVDLVAFFAAFRAGVPVENVPACILGRRPRPERPTLDTAMMKGGRLEIFRFTRRYILERYRTKSLRCRDCAENERCDGVHINAVRAHGYAVMQPIRA
jgi:MoaA/NifB/PqqE/SkfB family radical SAM enzyme